MQQVDCEYESTSGVQSAECRAPPKPYPTRPLQPAGWAPPLEALPAREGKGSVALALHCTSDTALLASPRLA